MTANTTSNTNGDGHIDTGPVDGDGFFTITTPTGLQLQTQHHTRHHRHRDHDPGEPGPPDGPPGGPPPTPD